MKRLYLVIIALAFILETPRNKILGLLGNAGSGIQNTLSSSREKSEVKDLPNPMVLESFTSRNGDGFIARTGHTFKCDENVWRLGWGTGDTISWTREADGSFTLYNSSNSTSTQAKLLSVRAENRGYY